MGTNKNAFILMNMESKGIEKGKIEVAKSALEKGADIDFVIKITGLDEWVVKKLKEEV